jgi:hypothetical protein
MNDNQRIVVEYIKKCADAHKLQLAITWSWSNVGKFYFRKGLKTVGTMSLDFQSGYVSAAFLKGSKLAQYFGENDKIWMIDYTNIDKIEEFNFYIGRLT